MASSSSHKTFLYEEIIRYIRSALDSGTLLTGEKVPSLRTMADRFECSVSVVLQAYGMLEDQGTLRSVEKSGYFACSPRISPLPSPEKEVFSLKPEEARPVSIIGQIVEAGNDYSIVPLGAGIPGRQLLPYKGIEGALKRVLSDRPGILGEYSNEAGSLRLREEIAALLLARGVTVSPEEILITNGCCEALALALETATSPGDLVAIESPVFLGVIQLLNELKRRVVPVPTSPEKGIDLERLEEVFRGGEVKVVMLSAVHQNPLGYVMPRERREAVCALAKRYEVTIIEDDLYADCSFSGDIHRPLKGFDRSGRVIYCSSFSKTLAPGMRIGWAVGGRHHRRMRNLKLSRTLGGSLLLQEGLAEFLSSSRYGKHVVQFRKTIARQARQMKPLLQKAFPEGTAISSPRGGLYYWLELPGKIDSLTLFHQALSEGISIVPGRAFSSGDRFDNCIRVSFGAPLNEEMAAGIERLGRLAAFCCEEKAIP